MGDSDGVFRSSEEGSIPVGYAPNGIVIYGPVRFVKLFRHVDKNKLAVIYSACDMRSVNRVVT